jgi:hypothetical protein
MHYIIIVIIVTWTSIMLIKVIIILTLAIGLDIVVEPSFILEHGLHFTKFWVACLFVTYYSANMERIV